MPARRGSTSRLEQGRLRADPRRRRRLRHRGRRLPLAVASHATSKIATPTTCFASPRSAFAAKRWPRSPKSAASSIRSRTADSASGAELEVVGGAGVEPSRPAAARSARRSKSATVLQHAGAAQVPALDADRDGPRDEAFTRLALAHPQVHFTLPHNGRSLHDLPPVADSRARIAALLRRRPGRRLDRDRQHQRRRDAWRVRGQSEAQPRQPAGCSICFSTAGRFATARCSTPWAKPIADCCSPAAIRSLSAPRHAGGVGRRQRPSDEAGSALSRLRPALQPIAGHAADEVPDDRSDGARGSTGTSDYSASESEARSDSCCRQRTGSMGKGGAR